MRFNLPISTIEKKQKLAVFLIFSLLFTFVFPRFISTQAQAAVELTEAFIRLDRLKASTATAGTVCTKPSATHTTALDAVKVTFPTGFTVNTTGANWAGSASTLGGATAMPGIAAATPTVSGQIVTWTFATDQTVTAATMYCFTFTATSTLTNSTAGDSKTGTVELTDASAPSSETSDYALSIVANDQITVDADVPAIFTLAFADTAMEHGILSTSTVDTDAAGNITIGTNAENGWYAWIVADSTNGAGLYSTATADTLSSTDTGSPVVLSAGTEGWVIDVQSSNTVATEYDGNSTTSGGVVGTTFEQIASSTTVGTANTITLTSIAAISSINKAATDYQETLTVVASGNF